MNFGSVLKQLRRQKNVSQETLAEIFGISSQAVSKWECSLSYPDIELLPILAEYFGVSVDFLLTGEERVCADCHAPDNMNDDTLYIVQCRGNRILSKTEYDPRVRIMLKAENDVKGMVQIWGNADIEGNISGDLCADGGVNCGNVSGGVSAGDGVNCGNVSGGVFAGDGVNCGNVSGGVTAGDGVNCGNIDGCVNITGSGPVDIHCCKVTGSVAGARTVYVKE